jgi:hypothetical protein
MKKKSTKATKNSNKITIRPPANANPKTIDLVAKQTGAKIEVPKIN